MLLSFECRNFKSFAETARIDLRAAAFREQAAHVVTAGSARVLPVAAIFGPNGSGKSNILEALGTMATIVARPFVGAGGSPYPVIKPFALSEACWNAPAHFGVTFLSDAEDGFRTYEYAFDILGRSIVQERLAVKPRTGRSFREVFAQEDGRIRVRHMNGAPPAVRKMLEQQDGRSSLLVNAAQVFKIPELMAVRGWFEKVTDGALCADSMARAVHLLQSGDPREVHTYLSSFDPDGAYDVPPAAQSGEENTRAWHGVRHVGKDGHTVVLPLEEESSGTQHMLGLYSAVRRVLSHGGVLLADDLGAWLHPDLLAGVVGAFTDTVRNPGHAQLLFSTHAISLLGADILRRDEIHFAEKEGGASRLTRLPDMEPSDPGGRKVRADCNYEIGYRKGRFGARPKLSGFRL